MKGIRKFLTKILGVENYLFLISKVYIRMISMGFLKKKYPEIHFLKTIIQPNYICVDIGANLGYYSTAISRASSEGKVFCVEPIPLFIKIWKRNTRKCANVQLLPYALGDKDKKVNMAIPIVDGIVRHGLSKVVDSTSENDRDDLSFNVEMKQGDKLFQDFDRIDFIKCDIEGFEQYAISSLLNTIKTHRPIIQIELSGDENRKAVYTMLTDNNYKAFVLKENVLRSIEAGQLLDYTQDFYFVGEEELNRYSYIRT